MMEERKTRRTERGAEKERDNAIRKRNMELGKENAIRERKTIKKQINERK